MSTAQVLLVSEKAEEMRRRANFAPSIWGDRFIKYDYEKDKIHHARQSQEIQQLKEEVRKELLATVNHYIPKQQLELIDTIERLGLGYHFETEIQQVLQHLYDTYKHDSHQYDLYTAALCFRLLRQHGHFVSCDIFKKFKNDNDNFEESLASDVSGLLSFYEAAHVGVQGEDILDEAIAFTTSHLQSMAVHLANPLAAQVLHALRKPLHKCVPRIEARHYISIYQDEPSHNQALLKLAKLDFNLLQSLHKKELKELSKWMKESIEQIPFVRERMVEGYLWVLGMVHEPQHSIARIFLGKLVHILTIVDDLHDAYGTFEELTIFAEATERWDASCMDQLPEYMQIIYQLLLDFSKEIEGEMAKNGWPQSRVHYANEVVKMAIHANFDDAKWINDKRVPTMEEYLQSSLVTGGVGSLTMLLLITTDFGKKELLDWVLSRPTIITTSELHFRLMDDIRSHKFEGERGYTVSSVEIYMKQYGISEEEAYKKMHKLLDKVCKDINEEFLKHTHLPRTVLMFIFNYTRVIHLFYEKGDDFTCVGEEMKAYIESLLVDPVPM